MYDRKLLQSSVKIFENLIFKSNDDMNITCKTFGIRFIHITQVLLIYRSDVSVFNFILRAHTFACNGIAFGLVIQSFYQLVV